jgi:hypothetical protein
MFPPFGFDAKAAGPLPDLLEAYFAGVNQMAQGLGPMKGIARCQLEMMGLMSRRAQAYLEIPSRLSRCQSPQSLMLEQLRFWQNAFQQYSESSRHIMDAWGQAGAALLAQSVPKNGKAASRDYISFGAPAGNDPKAPVRLRPRQVA